MLQSVVAHAGEDEVIRCLSERFCQLVTDIASPDDDKERLVFFASTATNDDHARSFLSDFAEAFVPSHYKR